MKRANPRESESGRPDAVVVDDERRENELHVEDGFSLHATRTSIAGQLERTDYQLETECGSCHYTTLRASDYHADWGSYGYRAGLTYLVCIDEPCIELCFQLRGAAERVVNASDVDLGLGAGETSVVVVPAFRASHELERDLRGAAFDVTLSRSYFMELAGRHPELLQGVAEMLLANRFGVMSPSHMRITPQMWGIIQRIQSDTAAASVGSLFFEAAILELLALQLQQPQRSVVSDGIELSRAEVDGLHAVRDLLLGRIDDPPRLAELARHAMTNEYKLKRGFKALFGISPYAYLLQHRLELARRYLLDTDRSIAEIARRVGYRDPAHFTNAFRKGYGVRPSDLRRSARV